MRSENNIGTDFHRSNKDIGYTHEFRDFIKKDPKVIADFKHLWKRLDDIRISDLRSESVTQTFTEGSIHARVINTYQLEEESNRVYYFQLTIGGESFFVKCEGMPFRGKGYEEYKNTSEVRERLKEIPWVDTVEFMLGYQDEEGRSLYVSKWLNLPLLNEYISGLDQFDNRQDIQELNRKVGELQKLLPEFHDLTKRNMFFDPESKKIILFDLHTKSQDLYR